MTWTTPTTFGGEATAAKMNTEVRDNLLHLYEFTGRGVKGYVQVTANQSDITSQTDLDGLTITFTAEAGRRYEWQFSGEVTTTIANGAYVFVLTDEFNGQKKRATGDLLTTSSLSVNMTFREAPGAGPVTRKMRLSKAGGSGSVGLGAALSTPAFLTVDDVGPA